MFKYNFKYLCIKVMYIKKRKYHTQYTYHMHSCEIGSIRSLLVSGDARGMYVPGAKSHSITHIILPKMNQLNLSIYYYF